MMLATSDNDAAIAVFVSLFLFGGPVFGFVAVRYMKHRERMAMIAQGLMPNGQGVRPQGMTYVPGPGGQTVFIPDPAANYTLRRGIRLAFIGLALLIGLSFIGMHGDGIWVPGPWLLGGLIPMFVGIAQIVTAVISGAQFTVPNWQRQAQEPPIYSVPPNPPPPPGPPGTPGQAGYGGPYTYRPPGDVPEIPKTNQPRQR